MEKPWKEMAVDVDSLVFFYMRKYLDIPYPTRKDEKLVCAGFVHDTKKSAKWIVDDMAKYSAKQLLSLLKYLESNGLVLYPVYSTGYPKLKRDLYDERLQKKNSMEATFLKMDPDTVLSSMKKYMLYFRDDVRDIVVQHPKLKHLHKSTEADKWCGKNHRVIMSEDVDIFLFGNKRTTIVKPFLLDIHPTHFDFVDCKSYFMDKGISTHDEFVQVAFMSGTDYNRGIKGMGVKKSVAAIAKYGTIQEYIRRKYDLTDENAEEFVKKYKQFSKYVF
jgi:5'-3' exonuclease